jgi:hypothetical protein
VLAAVALLSIVGSACTRGLPTASVSAQPQDLFTAMPSVTDVRALLGDNTWWPGPPSFGVRPLDVASMPITEKFSVTQPFVHIGTAETLVVDFTLWNATSAATTHMTNVQSALGTSATGPKVGDQSLYYGSQLSGAAPYDTASIVRLGQIVATISWNLKGGFPKVAQLGQVASKVVSRLKDVVAGKLHGSELSVTDSALLPPAGLDVTLLGTASIPIEAAMVMLDPPSIDGLTQSLIGLGVGDVVFGDYVVNSDTHMEVRSSVFKFTTTKDAGDWLTIFRGTSPVDQEGIASFYDAPHGRYMFLFASGTRGAVLICQSTAASEAASRSCEAPVSRVVTAWRLSLGA